MKLSKQLIILLFLFTSISTGYSQFYKKFSFEIGANRSRVINTKQLITEQPDPRNSGTIADLRSETASYSNNYSFSIGYQVAENHHIRIRRAYNSLGSHLTGKFTRYDGFCGVMINILDLKNAHNLIKNVSLGAIYEFQIPIPTGKISIEIGGEKHWNKFEDTYILVQGMDFDNYALHTSLGYLAPIFDYVHLHPKLFITKTFNNLQNSFPYGYYGDYLPLQIGVEIGVRFQLKKN